MKTNTQTQPAALVLDDKDKAVTRRTSTYGTTGVAQVAYSKNRA